MFLLTIVADDQQRAAAATSTKDRRRMAMNPDTDPPALAFANAMHEESGAAVLSYVTVYPLVMFLRIMSPQIITLFLWTSGG